jgi:hypothetical protein
MSMTKIQLIIFFKKMFKWNQKVKNNQLQYFILRKKLKKMSLCLESERTLFDKRLYLWMCNVFANNFDAKENDKI